ncbi:MAG TPA: polyphosphate kinase 2 family protein [Clostridia bacterium]|nr:polyphosphate kinase 2 family protein [Clostridia bacterium]
MNLEKQIEFSCRYAHPYRVTKGKKFQLKHYDPNDTGDLQAEDKLKARETLKQGIEVLARMQDMLYAQDRWALLLIFQAMDAAGKDGAIKHVMSGINPQGCHVVSFKAPSPIELDHDFLWRCTKEMPERGRIGIFNRSYYEEVLVVRVHPEILAKEKLPPELVTKNIWNERYEDIRALERYLGRNGTVVRKFFLHVSRKEQKKRFLERINNPAKNWKFSSGDVQERKFWKDYMNAYEDMIRNTATEEAPWYVVPADNKWYTRIVVAAAIIDALASINLHYPQISKEQLKELAKAKKALLAEK